ncbi:helix-turn-helix domain-containing protein [Candidatus Peregrinibacteria bacterium]|jgi:excisionase family DNA binding protein|nr:helix-turn-helix domain-containing protein [Candidatus Peregrinibacteria bacterium]MBT4148611.1 helix-turn-helix domain-containing protein [Candidatus Peregrinibacteria bacterium]MBT4455772.1 helix-turn-helix domain-containing protein [Candidatus Peregrinibacteria bacterium]
MEQYLTSEQVAKLLQVHQFTVLKYLKDGRIKGVKIGRVYRIKESEVENFLNRVSTTKEEPKAEEPKVEKPVTVKEKIEEPRPTKLEDEYFKLL